jgi:hypothetical protein
MPASHCPEMVARWLHETSIYFMFNFVFTSPEFSRIWVKCAMIAAMLWLLLLLQCYVIKENYAIPVYQNVQTLIRRNVIWE